jgi:hypothetical protein
MSSDDCSRVIRENVRPSGEAYLLLAVEICIKGLSLLFAGKLAYGGACTLSAAGICTNSS